MTFYLTALLLAAFFIGISEILIVSLDVEVKMFLFFDLDMQEINGGLWTSEKSCYGSVCFSIFYLRGVGEIAILRRDSRSSSWRCWRTAASFALRNFSVSLARRFAHYHFSRISVNELSSVLATAQEEGRPHDKKKEADAWTNEESHG